MIPLLIPTLWAIYASLWSRVRYGLGAKARETPFFKRPLAALAALAALTRIDCSGFVRLLIFRATGGQLLIPDGSQMQREFFEDLARRGLIREVDYADAARYMAPHRVFICFIRPFHKGCGKVGHVWLLLWRKGEAVTLESHGGKGVNSRPWNSKTLLNQVYSCFELPALLKAV